MQNPQKGLGRGLASLIPVKREESIPAATTGLLKVPITAVVPNPLQPRQVFNEEKIKELSESIREKGILQPLVVTQKNNHYELISGERRLRAARLAGLTEVPVIIREAVSGEILELALIENIQRQDLDSLEEAMAYQALQEKFEYTQEQIAQKVGKDRATVANSLRLLKLPILIKEALQSGKITPGHARVFLSIPEVERQLYYLGQLIKENWSVREFEKRVETKRKLRQKSLSQTKALPANLAALLDTLRRRLGTQVRLVPSGTKGKIIIEYYSEVDLDRLYQTLIRSTGG